MNELTFIQPDDWHCHLRDGNHLSRTVTDTARQFGRALVMPNLQPPITQVPQALEYRNRILSHIPADQTCHPLMTLYLIENMSPAVMVEAKKSQVIAAGKYYPAGATTHSDDGVSAIEKIFPLLEQMQACDLVLCVHGESIAKNVDIFDREKLFLIDLEKILKNFPTLRIVLEHVSTKAAVDFVSQSSHKLAATITPHHLYYN